MDILILDLDGDNGRVHGGPPSNLPLWALWLAFKEVLSWLLVCCLVNLGISVLEHLLERGGADQTGIFARPVSRDEMDHGLRSGFDLEPRFVQLLENQFLGNEDGSFVLVLQFHPLDEGDHGCSGAESTGAGHICSLKPATAQCCETPSKNNASPQWCSPAAIKV